MEAKLSLYEDKYEIIEVSREEYDGSEWWQINNVNVYSEDDDYKDFDKLKVNSRQIGWKTVEEINEEEEDG